MSEANDAKREVVNLSAGESIVTVFISDEKGPVGSITWTPQAFRDKIEEVQTHIRFLEYELVTARKTLEDLYQATPPAPMVRGPFKSDIKITCTACGTKTLWRTGRGAGKCYPACAEKSEVRNSVKQASLDAAFRILFDEVEE